MRARITTKKNGIAVGDLVRCISGKYMAGDWGGPDMIVFDIDEETKQCHCNWLVKNDMQKATFEQTHLMKLPAKTS